MPADFSSDLRARIVEAARTDSASTVAQRFGVSIRTVVRLRARARSGEPLERRQTTFGPARLLSDDDRARFEAYLAENPSMTHAQMAERFEQETGRALSRQTVQLQFARWKITRKKSDSDRRSSLETT